jgi:hypothetical protein
MIAVPRYSSFIIGGPRTRPAIPAPILMLKRLDT